MDFLANLDLTVFLQLTFVTLILVSGPAVIFILALNKGDM